MNIDGITNGLVIDHIEAGKGMELYNALHLGELESSVALIKNVTSHKMGKKDIIKVDEVLDVDLDILGFRSLAGLYRFDLGSLLGLQSGLRLSQFSAAVRRPSGYMAFVESGVFVPALYVSELCCYLVYGALSVP